MKFVKALVNILLVVAILLLGSLLCVGSIYVIMGLRNSSSEMSHTYRFLSVNPTSNRVNTGSLTLSHEIENGFQFLEKDEEGYYHLISNLGSTEYTCHGTCYCEHNNNERRSSSSLVRPLYYLVAAASSVLAVNFANEYFQEKCESVLSIEESCALESITSEVNSCDPFMFSMLETLPSEHEGSNNGVDGEELLVKYQCSGHCMDKIFDETSTTSDELKQKITDEHEWKKGSCEELTFSSTVTFSRLPSLQFLNDIGISTKVKFVESGFKVNHLGPFCKKKSTVYIGMEMHTVCMSGSIDLGDPKDNLSVKCEYAGNFNPEDYTSPTFDEEDGMPYT